ncbi:MAG TPA: ABATE domain-containing protein [Candidatus Dormibacteraeota bacterium]|nr:ABATE domain-containing protein [Candidatus Dormibacteraeota bacterium]
MADRESATGPIGLVQAFVNSVDLQDGPEELATTEALGAWLSGRGLLPLGSVPGEEDLRHAIALREALRGIVGANSGGAVYPVDVATLNEAASASKLRARFGPDGKARLEPDVSGVTGALGRIVAAAFTAMADDDWSRLKLCSSQTCRWAFFDRSRNHSSRWCTMASCGNRAKARRFRAQATKA